MTETYVEIIDVITKHAQAVCWCTAIIHQYTSDTTLERPDMAKSGIKIAIHRERLS